MVVMETDKSTPPTDTHTMHYHNHHLKKKKKTCMSSQMPGEHVGFCELSHSIC